MTIQRGPRDVNPQEPFAAPAMELTLSKKAFTVDASVDADPGRHVILDSWNLD